MRVYDVDSRRFQSAPFMVRYKKDQVARRGELKYYMASDYRKKMLNSTEGNGITSGRYYNTICSIHR